MVASSGSETQNASVKPMSSLRHPADVCPTRLTLKYAGTEGNERLQHLGRVVMVAGAYGLGMDKYEFEADALLQSVDEKFWSVSCFLPALDFSCI